MYVKIEGTVFVVKIISVAILSTRVKRTFHVKILKTLLVNSFVVSRVTALIVAGNSRTILKNLVCDCNRRE